MSSMREWIGEHCEPYASNMSVGLCRYGGRLELIDFLPDDVQDKDASYDNIEDFLDDHRLPEERRTDW